MKLFLTSTPVMPMAETMDDLEMDIIDISAAKRKKPLKDEPLELEVEETVEEAVAGESFGEMEPCTTHARPV